jgi:hypothetical protein
VVPVALTYTTPNNRCGGGRFIYPNAVLDIIAARSEGQFALLNTNRYQDIWPEIDQRPDFGGPGPVMIIWSSYGWDSKRSRLYLFGGGHANTNDSGVYYWDAFTREWGLAFYSPEDITDPNGAILSPSNPGAITKDGPLISPVSAHTYGNNGYLEKFDRFVTFGGAAHSNGGPWRVWDENAEAFRHIFGYMMQPGAVGLGLVSGLTGNNFKRNGSTVDKIGARAWQVLDYKAQVDPDWPVYGGISGSAVPVIEEGTQVAYIVSTNFGNKNLEKITIPSVDPTTHSYARVGITASNNIDNDCGAAIDYERNVLFIAATGGNRFWDLKTQGPTNALKTPVFEPSADYDDYVATVNTAPRPGCASDPSRPGVFAYRWGGKVFQVRAPAGNPTPTTGWTVTKVADETDVRPLNSSEIVSEDIGASSVYGVLGKFRYAKDLDAYIIIQHSREGYVWAWKPPAWQDPRFN